MISDTQRIEVADALVAAERDRRPIDPPTVAWPGLDVDDAYEIQLINIRRRRATGGVVRGHKVGLTSRAMQEMLGVDEPDYGHLMADMVLPDGSQVAADELCWPRAEVELAFLLGRPLSGPSVELSQVLAATEFVVPAIEIIDSRVRDWKITLVDTIADNASSARVVLGAPSAPPDPSELGVLAASLLRNGEVAEAGVTGAVLDNPANAVAWLANKLASFGTSLEPGQLIMPGACTRAIDVHAGDTIVGELERVGSVSVHFC